MPGLEELTARYERMTEVLEDEMYMMHGYLIDEAKISYDFKDILNSWSNLTMEDLDRIHSSIPRHTECLNELGKVLSKEKSRRRLKEQIDLKVKSENAKQTLKKRRLSKRLSSRNLGGSTDGSTDASRGNGEGMETMDH